MVDNQWEDVPTQAISTQDAWEDVPSPQNASNDSINIFGTNIPTGTNLNKIKQATSDVEDEIAQRHSFIKDMIKDPTTANRFMKHPLGTTLRTLMGAGELVGGTTADLALAAQRGTTKGLGSDLLKTLVGQRPADLGDVAKASALPGISNPAVATGIDILANSAKGSPMSGVGELIGKGLKPATNIADSIRKAVINPRAAAIMKFASGVPEQHALEALNNPNILDNAWLAKEGKVVGPRYTNVVHALEDTPGNNVNLDKTRSAIKDLRIQTALGEVSPQMGHLTLSEQATIKDLVDEFQYFGTKQNPMTFTRGTKLLADMDEVLKPAYKHINAGQPVPSDAYQRLITTLRGSLRKDLGEQFPEYDKVATRYHNFLKAKAVNESFSKSNLSFQKAIPARILLGALGAGTHGAALAAMPLTMPIGQRGLLKFTHNIAKAISEPTVTMDVIKKLKERD